MRTVLSVSRILLLFLLLSLSLPSALPHDHPTPPSWQDKDNFAPWEQLLSAVDFLKHQRDQPTPSWIHLFQSLDSLSPLPSSTPTLIYNITTPILPALLHLYSPPSILTVTPYPLHIPSPSRTLRSLSIPLFSLQPPLHLHGLCLFHSSSSPSVDRTLEDRRRMKEVEKVMEGGGVVLIIQRWERGGKREEFWRKEGPLLPKGWRVEKAWGWTKEAEKWRLSEEWRAEKSQFADDLMTVWMVRVREDVDTGDTEELEDITGMQEAHTMWDKAVEAVRPPMTWMPYHARHRL